MPVLQLGPKTFSRFLIAGDVERVLIEAAYKKLSLKEKRRTNVKSASIDFSLDIRNTQITAIGCQITFNNHGQGRGR